MDRVRAFIDSNIVISAIVFDRNELEVIESLRLKGYQLVISYHIHEEIFRVMLDKFPEYISMIDEFIRLSAIEIVPVESYIDSIDQFNFIRDRWDRHVLAAAVAAKCELIITGDKDLLILNKVRDIRILTSKGAKKYG